MPHAEQRGDTGVHTDPGFSRETRGAGAAWQEHRQDRLMPITTLPLISEGLQPPLTPCKAPLATVSSSAGTN